MTRRKKNRAESIENEVRKEIKQIARVFEAQKVYAAIVIIAAVFFVVGFFGSSITASTNGVTEPSVTADIVEAKVVDFINANLIQEGSVEATSIEEVSGMYEINVSYQGQNIPVYATKDGKMLIVQGIGILDLDMEVTEPEPQEQEPVTCEDMPKSGSPVLEAFVVSYCPYGLQMQRILAEVAPVLGENIKVRYMGAIQNGVIQAMHGEQEATENHRQICLREEQADKYWDYISCFAKAGDTSGCLESTGVDTAELDACMSDYERGVTYASVDFGLQTQYGVSGSPTLIMNGQSVSEFNFGAYYPEDLEKFNGVWGRSAEALKTLLCCGFTEEPGVCSQTLDTASASTGFSETYSGDSSSGSC